MKCAPFALPAIAATAFIWSLGTPCRASEVRLVAPYSASIDPLIKLFRDDQDLANGDIRIAVEKMESSSGALKALVKGQADLGLFSLDAFVEAGLSERVSLVTLMSQPFQFRSTEELFGVQDSAFGDAVFAEINRANLLPLVFWNQGLSRIVSVAQMSSAEDFKGKAISVESKAASDVFERLGASAVVAGQSFREPAPQLTGFEVSLFAVEGAIKETYGRTLITGVRPTVGVLAASVRFWKEATEEQKHALARAASLASEKAQAAILAMEETELSRVAKAGIKYTSFDDENFRYLQSVSGKSYYATQKVGDPAYVLKALADTKLLAQRDGSKKKTRSDASPSPAPVDTSLKSPTIYFATDRLDEQHHDLQFRFGSKRSEHVTCGQIAYESNLARRPGDSFENDIGLHRYSIQVGIRDCALFLNGKLLPPEPLLVFVHGYNTTFKDAIWRAIALAEDIRFSGPVLVWSWPSDGTIRWYPYDEVSTAWSAPHFSQLLSELVGTSRKIEIDIFSHSMGARLSLLALDAVTRNGRRIRSKVFAAPDEDRLVFERQIKALKGAAGASPAYEDATLYGSINDRAILASQYYHGGLRAGSGGASILVLNEAESVDTSLVPSHSFFGHGYVFENQRILNDIRFVLIGRLRAGDARRRLEQRSKNGMPFWLIP